jgi:hypothetical protein
MTSGSMLARLAAADCVDIWPEPKPLPSGLPAVQPFDLAMLPSPFASWVGDIAERMQAPAEFVAVPAIVAAGSVIGRKVGIRPQENTDWYEVPNLWGCIVGRPGVMKSAAVQQALKPLNSLQAEARRMFEVAKASFDDGELEREMRSDARKQAMKKRLKESIHADLADLAEGEEDAPLLRRYLANDTSYQVLGELLIENPNGLLVHRDELLSLLRSLDREENVEARGFYLSAWNGTDDYVFDRIIRGKNLHVPSVTVSMIGTTQPGRIRDYASAAIKGGAGDDGLMQRFSMLVWPDTSPEWREHDRVPEGSARAAAHAAFARLDSLTPELVRATHDPSDDSRPYLRFDNEALGLFQEWRHAHEHRIRSSEFHPALESHLAKYRKLVPALALVHHLVDAGTGPVRALSVLSALAWSEFLESHAQRVYAAAFDKSAAGAQQIIRAVRREDLDQRFAYRDIQRKCWSGLTERGDITASLELLEERGWIRQVELPVGERGGRPAAAYDFNPKGRAR